MRRVERQEDGGLTMERREMRRGDRIEWADLISARGLKSVISVSINVQINRASCIDSTIAHLLT